MQRLLRLYPDAVMTVDEGPHARLLSDLKFGTIDLIIGALREPRLGGDVVEHELFGDPYVVAARDGHPLAGRATIRKTDLAAFDWVVPQRHVPRRAVIDGLLGQLPAIPRQVIETSSLAMMMATLVESDCLTLLARSQIHQAFSGSEIVALPLAAPESVRTVGMTTRADWLATAVQEAFMAQLREESIRHSTPPTPLARRAARR
jgi:DNA-binding transcriptional LysR family regulator